MRSAGDHVLIDTDHDPLSSLFSFCFNDSFKSNQSVHVEFHSAALQAGDGTVHVSTMEEWLSQALSRE